MMDVWPAGRALAYFDTELAKLANPHHRQSLASFRTHWYGEVTGDIDLAMSVVSEQSDFSVIGALAGGEAFAVHGKAAHRAVLEALPRLGLNAGGSFSNIRLAFADWGVMMEATYANVVYGNMLANLGDLDADRLFLFRAPMTMVCEFNGEGIMCRKRDYFGAATAEPADLDVLARLISLEDHYEL